MTLFGRTEVPRWTAQEMSTRAGSLPSFLAISWTVGSSTTLGLLATCCLFASGVNGDIIPRKPVDVVAQRAVGCDENVLHHLVSK